MDIINEVISAGGAGLIGRHGKQVHSGRGWRWAWVDRTTRRWRDGELFDANRLAETTTSAKGEMIDVRQYVFGLGQPVEATAARW